jgi:hypothetical protein
VLRAAVETETTQGNIQDLLELDEGAFDRGANFCSDIFYLFKTKLNSVALVRKRTIPTERPPLVGEVSANFCG